jgi:FkbM family methyltransferase
MLKFKTQKTKKKSKNTQKSIKPIILYNTQFYEKQEKQNAYMQGKGYGASSIQKEVELCIHFIKHTPSIFIDIGAEKGTYTKEVLKYFPDIEVFMFEPSTFHKKLYEKSLKNMSNVNINYLALSNVNGKQKLYYDKAGSALASLTKRRLDHLNINFENSEEIQTIRFDDFWKTTDIYKNNPNTIIDYVKIDVEGHELDVLKGFGNLLDKIGIIQFEFGGSNIDTRTYFQDFWYLFKDKKYDFTIYRISPNGLIPITKYLESDEYFSTTNYIVVNNKINKKIITKSKSKNYSKTKSNKNKMSMSFINYL